MVQNILEQILNGNARCLDYGAIFGSAITGALGRFFGGRFIPGQRPNVALNFPGRVPSRIPIVNEFRNLAAAVTPITNAFREVGADMGFYLNTLRQNLSPRALRQGFRGNGIGNTSSLLPSQGGGC